MDRMERLKSIIDRYNWRQQSGDILRSMYHDYVPDPHRKIYGEYYTPDWLADLICQKVIDDDFIKDQIGNHNAGKPSLHVVDPCCGSGTFLYHAAKRILESRPVAESGMERHDVVRMACSVVRGIDIHPVAVEMSRANMRRLLPEASDSDIVVYQGDSLLTQRPESKLYRYDIKGDVLALVSPTGMYLNLPRWFTRSPKDVAMFVETARNNLEMTNGLGASLENYNHEQLLEAHNQLKEIIRHEADGVWKWYILNQAGPMNLLESAGRIVSNPPWVRYNTIQVESRQREIRDMAVRLGLWTGGKVATSFDISSLFVDRCLQLYMKDGYKKSGWVLPHGSLRGGGWKGFRKKLGDTISCTWNLKRLPFPNTPTCTTFFDVDEMSASLVKLPRRSLNAHDTWEIAETKTTWDYSPIKFPESSSEWMDDKGRPLARNGATLVPYCLLVIDSKKAVEHGDVKVTTRRSSKTPWSTLGSHKGTVPASWIRECVSTENLVSFFLPTTFDCILPLKNGGWDESAETNQFWKNQSDLYRHNCGKGDSTPKTLKKQANFNNKLISQHGRQGDCVVYNSSGDNLYAARLRNNNHIVTTQLFYVPCTSTPEAFFLVAVLNANSLLPAFKAARRGDRDFLAHIWRAVPIPRYDPSSELHKDLASLGKRAERVSAKAYSELDAAKIQTHRIKIKEALDSDGVSIMIDDACSQLLPHHAGTNNRTHDTRVTG